jgi:hypothetical protein
MTTLIDQISALLAAPAQGEQAPALARLEHTLTEGYARALALEAERSRLERRIGQVAAELGEGDSNHEISSLARRLSDADGEISRLRAMLVSLPARANEVRAA